MKIQFEKLLSQDLKIKQEERVTKPRDYFYASNVGKAFLDVYLELKGTEPTNPMDERQLRTFMVGHIFEDYIAQFLPKDIKVEREKSVIFQPENSLSIHGRVDFIIDGIPVELKTVNSRSFWYNAKGDGGFKPYEHHLMQLMIYMLALKVKESILVYISKDDATIEQVNIKMENEDELYKKVMKWLETMTKYYKDDIKPPVEDFIVMENGKYKANWRVIRSNYFNLITGTDDPHAIELQANRMNYKLKKEKGRTNN